MASGFYTASRGPLFTYWRSVVEDFRPCSATGMLPARPTRSASVESGQANKDRMSGLSGKINLLLDELRRRNVYRKEEAAALALAHAASAMRILHQ